MAEALTLIWAGADDWTGHDSASPVLGVYGKNLEACIPPPLRKTVRSFIPLLQGTAEDGKDPARGYLVLDWFIRAYVAAWLRLVPELVAVADKLAGLPAIRGIEDAAVAGCIVRDVAATVETLSSEAATTASDETWDIAWVAALDATWAAGRNPAWAVARGAVRDATVAAAWPTAWAMAQQAAVLGAGQADATLLTARERLAPTVTTLQRSAVVLFGRMINPAEVVA